MHPPLAQPVQHEIGDLSHHFSSSASVPGAFQVSGRAPR
ncbi:hypothetical protein SCATT_p14040 (plasmid) [Streptantibioticus cattleyicolor NRRL 8057 = DSM 46488]|uniref:Uncharacterized protein n=1 Tax=Streptantibioticus cattleyicolor (strain ATCC 35852 / DSM 46488 / JCM 4925 / NBRC 14057 / NRRL 8057) TaxID=1003195 RepID=G8XG66_STREN|nr:hypothetical protein SCATT_p14040 [Streptantibioticus cattleyicolor NRRL 8057 = DSM 46488]